MRILIANDDGLYSEGIQELAKELSKKHEVVVIAPYKNRSGNSHAITINRGLEIRRENIIDGIESYTINGTPVDCVRLGMFHIMKDRKPDLVLSGVNDEYNLGKVVINSGTVAVAREANLYDVPSIALSMDTFDFLNSYIGVVENLIENLYNKEKGKVTYNVNFPKCSLEKFKGVVFTKLGDFKYSEEFVKGSYKGKEVLDVIGGAVSSQLEGTDDWAIYNNYISVTPLKTDMTDYEELERLK